MIEVKFMKGNINMTIQELINKLNTYCKDNDIYSMDDCDEEICDELKSLNFKYVASVDRDEHRWYILSENVYEVSIGNKTYYIGTWEVETLKSECMSVSDCGCRLNFFEMEQYTTVSYRRKK